VDPGFWKYLLPSTLFFLIGNLFIYLFEDHSRLLTLLTQSHRKHKNRLIAQATPDPDVLAESERLRTTDLQQLSQIEPVLVSGLYKKFRNRKLQKFVAVRDLSFGVRARECFGLLGLNGAGKTTALGILTGELRASDGKAFINGRECPRPGLLSAV